ncbi:alanine acetyltransferase [Brevibacillus reuszeri]|uniref:Alanine acetyltransferase n=1 Tax=Brevibacillus reuszeri TaxID=54915 RepID=A0A0K9YSY7_9BACL|nr:GNAT family N-acetyltransferase [Brevibacillus reuszeri]KNB71305.1 GCN5 family acetyltransferase [Brevibacillus reuszeri]MED1857745.1 GNAT family N-acetyltransferase [Brevibacillus reuszeri]GED66423.1 alanine acetyltransferase [Brevibacillus reuszeri]
MKVLETDRLILRWQTVEDAPFILSLVNDPAWLQFIGDRGVRTVEDARNYIVNSAISYYERYGFGFYLTEIKEGNVPIGICGMIKRDTLEDVDIGFAFLPDYRGMGYGYEAASAVLSYARDVVGLKRLVAITDQDNHASGRLLEKIGLHVEGTIQLGNNPEESKLFAIDFQPAAQ